MLLSVFLQYMTLLMISQIWSIFCRNVASVIDNLLNVTY